jgi:solute:Na+ symporter, SSS family
MLIFAVILYFTCTLGIGFIASRRVKTTGDFINAGRNLHPAVNTAALFALWFGSETIFGASAEFSEHGFSGVIEDPLGGVLCLLLVGVFFAKRLYRLNIYTIGDLFRQKYGPKVELLSTILMIISFIGYAAAQIVALGLISQSLLGISLHSGMLLSFSIVVVYTFTGGMWAVSVTDFIQSILIVAGMIAVSWYVSDMAGGIGPVFSSLTPEQKKILPDNTVVDWINWFSAWMVLGFGSIASQDIFQRVNSARSEQAAYTSTIAGAIIYLIFSMLPLYLMASIKMINPSLLQGDLQLVLPQFVKQEMPMWLQILFFGSLLSAIMSTCSGALLAPASLLSENIIKPNLKSSISDRTFLLLTRFSVVIISLVALILALGKQNIFELVGEASAIGLVTIFVPFCAALFFNHSNKAGAIISMLAGTLMYVVFRFIYVTEINPLLPGLLASMAGIVMGKWIGDQDKVSEIYSK